MPVGWYVISPPPVAEVAGTTAKAVAALFGQQPGAGTISSTKTKADGSFTGIMPMMGPMSMTTAKAVAALTGGQAFLGSFAAMTAIAQANFAQNLSVGNLASTLTKAVAGFNGSMATPVDGAITAGLKAAIASFNAQSGFVATLAAQALKTAGAFAGTQEQSGQLAAIAQKAIAALNGQQIFTGSFVSATQKADAALAGIQQYSGTLAMTTAKAAGAFSGSQATSVARVTTGTAGSQNGTGATRTCTTTITPASGANCLVVFLLDSHDGWYLPTGYTMTVVSNVDGSLTSSSVSDGTPVSQEQGSSWIFTKLNGITTGVAHTITVTFTVPTFSAINIIAQSAAYSGVTSITGAAKNRNNGSVMSINCSSGAGDMALFCGGFAT